MTTTDSDNYLDAVRFQGVVTGDATVTPEPSSLSLIGVLCDLLLVFLAAYEMR